MSNTVDNDMMRKEKYFSQLLRADNCPLASTVLDNPEQPGIIVPFSFIHVRGISLRLKRNVL